MWLKRLLVVLIGVMSIGALPLSASAADPSNPPTDYPFFGPQSGEDDFLWYGDDTWPKSSTQGLTIDVDETSLSFQSFIGNVTLDVGLIEHREITRFYLLANNRIVDFFDPAWDQTTNDWKRVYWLRFALDQWNLGSNVYFKVVAVTSAGPVTMGEPYVPWVVAWSNQTPTYSLKALPVTDSETHSWLSRIYDLLDEFKSTTAAQLDQINDAVKKIYEIKPETQAHFDQALAGLQAKLPTEQMKQQMNDAANVVKDSADRINNTPQPLKFGEINWMGEFTTSAVDFTDFEQQITALRRIVQITLWCEFFYFIILVLRPRLTV
jgi:hypothetical protein